MKLSILLYWRSQLRLVAAIEVFLHPICTPMLLPCYYPSIRYRAGQQNWYTCLLTSLKRFVFVLYFFILVLDLSMYAEYHHSNLGPVRCTRSSVQINALSWPFVETRSKKCMGLKFQIMVQLSRPVSVHVFK